MSVCIIAGFRINESNKPAAALYCNTSGFCFGPVFRDSDEAEAFLQWLPCDPREAAADLAEHVADFRYQAEVRANSEHESSGGKFVLREPIRRHFFAGFHDSDPMACERADDAMMFATFGEAEAMRSGHSELAQSFVERLPL